MAQGKDRHWVEPAHSRSRVRRAGEGIILGYPRLDADELEILSNWRASHARPLHTTLVRLRRYSNYLDSSADVVQRLKRLPSIVAKLRRFPKMSLVRMQDIGGCRAIVDSKREVDELERYMRGSKTADRLVRVKNYIHKPKESGYRGVHLVYKYNGQLEAFRGLLVEVQLRSRIQHAWATAVEMVDTYTSQALKASIGNEDWLRFFQLAGAEFAVLETRSDAARLRSLDRRMQLRELFEKLQVRETLLSCSAFTEHTCGKNKEGEKSRARFFLLKFEFPARQVRVQGFSELAKAIWAYKDIEREGGDFLDQNVVLVSADSINALRRGYPNYFGDTELFLDYLGAVI